MSLLRQIGDLPTPKLDKACERLKLIFEEDVKLERFAMKADVEKRIAFHEDVRRVQIREQRKRQRFEASQPPKKEKSAKQKRRERKRLKKIERWLRERKSSNKTGNR